MKKMLLIDGNGLVFRVYFATKYSSNNHEMMRASDGTPTNAVFSFANMIELILQQNYDYVFVAFDAGKEHFRYKMMKSYKQKRKPTEPELIIQLKLVRELLTAYGIKWYEDDNYEADDIIATVAKKFSNDLEISVLSNDKDLWQLLDKNINIIMPDKGITQTKLWTKDDLWQKYKITPSQIPDLKSLMGDNSDNLPGVKGIGEKTAILLLEKYHTLEDIINNLENLSLKIKEKITNSLDMAILCKKMATLVDDINLDLSLNDLIVKSNFQKLKLFFDRYNIKTLSSKYQEKKSYLEDLNVSIIDTWKKEYQDSNNTLLVEFDQDNYHQSNIIAFSIVNKYGNFYYDYQLAKDDYLFLAFLASDKYQKDTFDLKRIINGCLWNNIIIKGIIFDLQIAVYLLNSSIKTTLENCLDYFKIDNQLSDKIFFAKKKNLVNDLEITSRYYVLKCFYLSQIKNLAIDRLKKLKQWDLYQEIEFPTAFILADMEMRGIKIDLEVLAQLENEIGTKVELLNNEINELAKPLIINLNSPQQLRKLLYEVLKLPDNKKGSTAQEVLVSIIDSHPIVTKILEYRKYWKLYTTYIKGFEKFIYTDQKVHTIYQQTLTTTGRLSSQEPNIQNISIHDEKQKIIRKIFISNNPEKQVILSCDYSQIELRLVAHIGNISSLIKAFNNNEDIHTATASKMFSIPEAEVSKEQRSEAKAVNFGIIYGISEFGLSQQLLISQKVAKKFMEVYFEQFPEIQEYMEKTAEFARENGFVKTIFERYRYLPDIKNRNFAIREFSRRAAINSPIQGSAADIIKIALIKVNQQLKLHNLNSYLVAQIHDELILEVYKDELETVKVIVKEVMENIGDLRVKLVVDMAVGKNWYELK